MRVVCVLTRRLGNKTIKLGVGLTQWFSAQAAHKNYLGSKKNKKQKELSGKLFEASGYSRGIKSESLCGGLGSSKHPNSDAPSPGF